MNLKLELKMNYINLHNFTTIFNKWNLKLNSYICVKILFRVWFKVLTDIDEDTEKCTIPYHKNASFA
ncbi:hypothetical protein C1646_751388 [Rhizophagus diaphanus]|nr:hypothetical protein C1646_751388 [Rhizophagus diaphanus] [Rhizophagus sp. MUCL 43196]